MDFMLILHIDPKDEFPGPDGTEMVPGYEPDAAEVAQYLQDDLGDATKHDGRIGWRLRAVVTNAPISDLAASWETTVRLRGAARRGVMPPEALETERLRRCARELRQAAGLLPPAAPARGTGPGFMGGPGPDLGDDPDGDNTL